MDTENVSFSPEIIRHADVVWIQNNCISHSQYWNIVYGRLEGEASLDAEGMQTMRSLAKNMAYLLKATEGKPKPEYESRQTMHFIR